MFKPGQSGNLKGRPKGSRNIATGDLRENIKEFIDRNWQGIQASYEKLEPQQQLNFIEKLLKFAVPPLQNVNIQTETRSELETMSETQIVELAKKILAQ